MNTVTTIGLDLAKNVFALCEVNSTGRVLNRRMLRRDALPEALAQLPAGTIIGMEACSGAHHWGRLCTSLGLEPRIMAAHLVKPFRMSRRTKNDHNDAEAIATAVRQGNMRFVPLKDTGQQARLTWHRIREGYKQEATAAGNRLRGLLAEFGIVIPRSISALKKALARLDEFEGLPQMAREALQDLGEHWTHLQAKMLEFKRRIEAHAQADARSVLIQQVSGIGPITADAAVSMIGNGWAFKNGRQLSAWVGLTPSQHSSGGKINLGSISKRGDRYLRTLLVQGAWSALRLAARKPEKDRTPDEVWMLKLRARTSPGKTMVAIANKRARQLWAMLAHGADYDPAAVVRTAQKAHPHG